MLMKSLKTCSKIELNVNYCMKCPEYDTGVWFITCVMLLQISNTMKNGTFLCDLVPKLKCTYQRYIIALDHCVSCCLYQSVTCTTAIAFCVHIGQARGAFFKLCETYRDLHITYQNLGRSITLNSQSVHHHQPLGKQRRKKYVSY